MKQPELGNYITQLRQQQEMTQEELAEACQINVRSIQRLEAGETYPRSSTIKRINRIFDTDIRGEEKQKDNIWLILMHLSSIFPVVIFALVIWYWKRSEDSRIEYQGIDVLNFQFSMWIYLLIASGLVFLVVGLFILPVMGMAITMISITNAIKVAQGHNYHYPFTLAILSH